MLRARWDSFEKNYTGKPVTYATIRRMANAAREATRKEVVAPGEARKPAKEVRTLLDLNDKGRVFPTLGNLAAVLRRWDGVPALRFNEWDAVVEYDGRPVEDNDYTKVRMDVEQAFAKWGENDVVKVMRLVAREDSYNPVRDYLEALQWDGVKRLDTWLVDYCGAEDSTYTRAVGALHLTAAVARAMCPGTQYDCMLVLEGPQGIGKSSTIRALAPRVEWFSDSHLDLRDMDKAYTVIQGVWLYEVSELASMSRRAASLEAVKAFITSRKDRFTRKYDCQALGGRLVMR